MAALWLVCGVAVLAYVTSTVTSVMTTISLTRQINGPADLPGKTVGVFTGSVAEQFARQNGFKTEAIANIDLAVDALVNGRIDAIVGDAPVLEYFDFSHPESDVTVVGKIFKPDKYGFGFRSNSDLTKVVTVELLERAENNGIEALRAKYFGRSQ
jgi:ABC-type amino acid transport substrate-binding protein